MRIQKPYRVVSANVPHLLARRSLLDGRNLAPWLLLLSAACGNGTPVPGPAPNAGAPGAGGALPSTAGAATTASGGSVASTSGGSSSGAGAAPMTVAGAAGSSSVAGGGALGGGGVGGAATIGAGGASGTPNTTAGANAGGASGAPSSTGGASASGSGGAGGHAAKDHCIYGYEPQPTNTSMKDGPAEYLPAGLDPKLVDLTVQPYVLDWMTAHNWQTVHVEWHAIRTCALPIRGLGSKVNICNFKQLIPKDQNCQTEGDGVQFLAMHRHMLESLKQLWPNHKEQFEGFPKFPMSAEDVPAQWREAWRPWSATIAANGKLGDEIDKPENLAKFPTEGALGHWLQCLAGAAIPNRPDLEKSGGIHFDLHAKWVRMGNTRHGVGNNDSNIDNYMFWKLHGWIDKVWESYRKAKGLTREDPAYKEVMLAQCREMDTLETIIRDNLKPDQVPDPNQPLPTETGVFHTQVRPIFESAKNRCSGCHSESGPDAGLSLGGNISSKKIVEYMINKPSYGGGQYKLVVPGKPDESWLYLKASGMAEKVQCTPSDTAACKQNVMPPDGGGQVTVSQAELATLRQWILDGAVPPP